MKVTFIGVGEAFDEKHTNVSMILEANGTTILLDCGYSVPHALWEYNDDPDFLDAIWTSHPHADHYFGVQALLMRMWEDGREKPIYILNSEMKDEILVSLEMAYPGFREKFNYDIEFVNLEQTPAFGKLGFKTAPTKHAAPNKAIRIEDEEKTFCYSGDGEDTFESKELYENADLLVHETYTVNQGIEGHGHINTVEETMNEQNVKACAIVHLNREVRKEENIKKRLEKSDQKMIMPKAGDVIKI